MRALFLIFCATSVCGFLEAAQPTNSAPASRTDYTAFKLITDRNIFNTRRTRGYTQPSERRRERPTTRGDSFALVGTMHYEKGPLAFFDGTRSDYRKVLKPEDTIAGFKVTEIDSSKVKLTGPTNEIELRIGMQLKHDNDSGWVPSERPESAEPSPGYSTTSHLSFTTVSNADKSGETQNGAPEGEFPPINLDAAQIFGGEPPGQPGSTNAAPAAPPIDGVTDPVLLRLMQRRAQERGE